MDAAQNQTAARSDLIQAAEGAVRGRGLTSGKWDERAEGARPGGLPGPSGDAEKHEGSELGSHLASVTNPKLQR